MISILGMIRVPVSRRTLFRVALVLGALATVGGCAPYVRQALPWEEGWREGLITEVGPGERLTRKAQRDCRAESDAAGAGGTFARIELKSNREPRKAVIVPVRDANRWRVMQPVYVNVRDCALGLEERLPSAREGRELSASGWETAR